MAFHTECKQKAMTVILSSIQCSSFSLRLKDAVRLGDTVCHHREGLLFSLSNEQGHTGWGEASPLPGFSIRSLEEVSALGKTLAGRLKERTVAEARQLLTPESAGDPAIYTAFHHALQGLSRYNQPEGMLSLCMLLDGSVETMEQSFQSGLERGYKDFKVKVGRQSADHESTFIHALVARLPEGGKLRLDANRRWDYEAARSFCLSLPREGIEFLEEPLKDWSRLGELQHETDIPCAVDETLQDMSHALLSPSSRIRNDLLQAGKKTAEEARALVWKPSLSFPPEVLGIESSEPCILSSAYESGVGILAVLHEACQRPGRGPAVGVDTYSRLTEDLLMTDLPLDRGSVSASTLFLSDNNPNPQYLQECWRV